MGQCKKTAKSVDHLGKKFEDDYRLQIVIPRMFI